MVLYTIYMHVIFLLLIKYVHYTRVNMTYMLVQFMLLNIQIGANVGFHFLLRICSLKFHGQFIDILQYTTLLLILCALRSNISRAIKRSQLATEPLERKAQKYFMYFCRKISKCDLHGAL